jgi:pseudouridine-5'-phosphate glycosidase
MRISEEVHQAINDGAPVVALESTIVAHGMPRPTNIETALAVEEVIRAHGAVPACVGLIRGEIVCGLTHDELSFLAYSDDVIKAQERDLARACVSGRSGATTVGATLFVASRCGIRVHVTGGIGGVAPDFGETLDISADLLAIGRYPCITVASGTKAFMDVRATLEYLETIGVPVATWGADTFPWFYSRDSGVKVEWRADAPDEVATAFQADVALRTHAGMLLGVPLPEADALPEQETRAAIDQALVLANQQGVSGKPLTPFLLSAIFDITGGASLAANVALIKNNAAVGAEVARSLQRIS